MVALDKKNAKVIPHGYLKNIFVNGLEVHSMEYTKRLINHSIDLEIDVMVVFA